MPEAFTPRGSPEVDDGTAAVVSVVDVSLVDGVQDCDCTGVVPQLAPSSLLVKWVRLLIGWDIGATWPIAPVKSEELGHAWKRPCAVGVQIDCICDDSAPTSAGLETLRGQNCAVRAHLGGAENAFIQHGPSFHKPVRKWSTHRSLNGVRVLVDSTIIQAIGRVTRPGRGDEPYGPGDVAPALAYTRSARHIKRATRRHRLRREREGERERNQKMNPFDR